MQHMLDVLKTAVNVSNEFLKYIQNSVVKEAMSMQHILPASFYRRT